MGSRIDPIWTSFESPRARTIGKMPKSVIENKTGTQVFGCRAPNSWPVKGTEWAPNILIRLGFRCGSRIHARDTKFAGARMPRMSFGDERQQIDGISPPDRSSYGAQLSDSRPKLYPSSRRRSGAAFLEPRLTLT